MSDARQKTSFIKQLSEDVRGRLHAMMFSGDLAPGVALLLQGQFNDSLYIVDHGFLDVTRNSEDAASVAVIAAVGVAGVLGAMSLLLGKPVSCSITANGAAKCAYEAKRQSAYIGPSLVDAGALYDARLVSA